MPTVTYLISIDGALWARLDLDQPTADGMVYIYTEKEIRKLKDDERKAVWSEIQDVVNKFDDDYRD